MKRHPLKFIQNCTDSSFPIFLPPMAKERTSRTPSEAPQKENRDHHQLPNKQEKWTLVRTLLGCNQHPIEEPTGKCKKMKPAGTPELHRRRPSSFLSSSRRSLRAPHPLDGPKSLSSSSSSSFNSLSVHSSRSSSSNSGGSGSFRGMTGLRRLSGCYECRMVVEPIAAGLLREPSLRSTICACPECGEIFMKPEIMELHLSLRHAGTRSHQTISPFLAVFYVIMFICY